MDRLRGPPVLNAGNKQQTDPVGFSDRISHKKGMTMNLKNKKGKRLTSTLMAVLMSVSTTLTPVNTMASEPEISSAAVESTLEETTAETQVQTSLETAVSKTQEQTVSEMAASEAQTSASEMQSMPETTAEAVCTEEVQTSGEGAEETSANNIENLPITNDVGMRFMTAEVANTQRSVSEKFDASKELMNKIETEYNRVEWQSEASESFKARFNKLKNDILMAFDNINNEFSKLMTQTQQDIENTEKANTVQ